MAKREVIQHVCDRCYDPTPIAGKVTFCIEDERHRLELCARHREALLAVLSEWANYGEQVPEHRPVIKFGQAPARAPGYSTAPIPFPVRVIEPEPEPELEPEVEPEPVAAELPFTPTAPPPPGGDEWHFTDHAIERMDERVLDPVEVLWAAVRPQQTVPDRDDPRVREHYRSGVYALVVPEDKLIITAYGAGDREQEQAELHREGA